MLKDSYYMLASSVLRLATQVLLFIVLARMWGAEKFGTFVYPLVISTLVVIVVDYGFGLQVLRDVGKTAERVKEIIWGALCLKVALSAVVLLLALVLTVWMPCTHGFRILLWLLLPAAVLGSFGLLLNLPFRALGLFHEETTVVLWANLVHFMLVGTLALLRFDTVVVAGGFLVSKLFYLVLSWRAYRRLIGRTKLPCVTLGYLLGTLRTGFPFAIHIALASLYFQVDTLIIHSFLGPEGVGVYQAGLRIMVGGLVLADVLGNVYIPRLAQASDSTKSLVEIGTRMTRHLLVPGALGFTLLIVFARWLNSLIYGAGYEGVAELLPLMGVVFFLRYLGVSYGALLTVANRQMVRAVGVSVAVVVSIGLNFLLIPSLGLRGAVLASIITHVVIDGVYVGFAWLQVQSLLMEWRSAMLLGTVVAANSAMLLFASSVPSGLMILFCTLVVLVLCAVGLTKQEWIRLSNKLVGA